MRHYEITFIVDPVLSGDELKSTVDMYVNQLKTMGCSITHINEWGLRQLAFPIKKRSNGVYFVVEVSCLNGDFVNTLELAFRRDERVIRYLTVSLDKYAVKYNDDKRKGLIGKKKQEAPKVEQPEVAIPEI